MSAATAMLVDEVYRRLAPAAQGGEQAWAQLAGRVYHLLAPPWSARPCVVFYLRSGQQRHYRRRPPEDQGELEVHVIGSADAAMEDLRAIEDIVVARLARPTAGGLVAWITSRGIAATDEHSLRLISRWQVRSSR